MEYTAGDGGNCNIGDGPNDDGGVDTYNDGGDGDNSDGNGNISTGGHKNDGNDDHGGCREYVKTVSKITKKVLKIFHNQFPAGQGNL